ncbi:MAG: glycosyltransferase [Bacteroidota bacterium]
MKVHVYGNVLNLGFISVKMLRSKGVDAILFLDDSSSLEQDYPWWDDTSIDKDNLPEWIKYYKTFPFYLFPNKETNKMIQDFSKCDVAFVSCYGPMLAMKAKLPFVFISAGSDLNMIDLMYDFKRVLFTSASLKSKIKKTIKILTYSPLQKRAIVKHANKVISGAGYQYKNFIEKNGILHKTLKLNMPKDIKNYAAAFDEELNEKYKKYKVVYFMLSRHTWVSVWNNYKGNDKFIKAFARFVKEYNPNVLFICSTKGIDSEKSMKLVKDLDIEQYIEWVDDMPKHNLKRYQSLPNMVMVDNFWHDKWQIQFPGDKEKPKIGFGFGSIESMASKRPLITAFTDHEFYGNENPPIFNAFTIDEIYDAIVQSYKMENSELLEMGERGYDFIEKWYDNESPENKILEVIEQVYKESFNAK